MKKRNVPALAEPLTLEKSWQWNGITVLRAQLALPQLALASRRARRFNAYYEQIGRSFFARTAQLLLPKAAEGCRTAMLRSGPWQITTVSLSYDITLQTDTLLSIALFFSMKPSDPAFCCADVWDTEQMLPIPLSEWFPPHTSRRRIAKQLRQTVPSDPPRRFRPHGYYLAENSLLFPARAGEHLSLPFDEKHGPFPLHLS